MLYAWFRTVTSGSTSRHSIKGRASQLHNKFFVCVQFYAFERHLLYFEATCYLSCTALRRLLSYMKRSRCVAFPRAVQRQSQQPRNILQAIATAFDWQHRIQAELPCRIKHSSGIFMQRYLSPPSVALWNSYVRSRGDGCTGLRGGWWGAWASVAEVAIWKCDTSNAEWRRLVVVIYFVRLRHADMDRCIKVEDKWRPAMVSGGEGWTSVRRGRHGWRGQTNERHATK